MAQVWGHNFGITQWEANGTGMPKEKTPAKQYGIDEPEIQS
jgi:hypothetical protein